MSESVGWAPGRINLIGEHTDYNDGLVLPIALRLGVRVAARRRDDRIVRAVTDAELEPRETEYALGTEARSGSWGDRVRGVTAALRERDVRLGGFDAEITSTLPSGAGLGSSAAFTIALIRAIQSLFAIALGDGEIVDLAHAVENGPFVGARAGLLDQLASTYGARNAGLLIDLRDRSTRTVPLPGSIELAVIDSGTRHDHATGGYNTRRAECEEAARHLGVASLRELEDRDAAEVLERLPPPLDRRVRHVLSENARVRDAVAALASGEPDRVGHILSASHRSLRDDYEVSTPELDRLVGIADHDPDVLGARLVGGGFGGSILALARQGRAREAGERIVDTFGGGRLVAVVP
jgi:galactokinase